MENTGMGAKGTSRDGIGKRQNRTGGGRIGQNGSRWDVLGCKRMGLDGMESDGMGSDGI